jgi:hypothetical protein
MGIMSADASRSSSARRGVESAEIVREPPRRAQQLAVHIQLPLIPCAVTDAHWTTAAPTRQMVELAFTQVVLATDPEHDLEVLAMFELTSHRRVACCMGPVHAHTFGTGPPGH